MRQKIGLVFLMFFMLACCYDCSASEAGLKGDINADGRIGLEEAVYALQASSGIVVPYVQWLSSIDFSKAYVLPNLSQTDKVTLGGIFSLNDSKYYSADFVLRDDKTLSITAMRNESSVKESLEQKLRNTVWKGTYDVHGDSYTTSLTLVVVQDGYVGGEVVHEGQGDNGSLQARVTGDILNQYQINGVFTDEDRIDPSVLEGLPTDTPTRQLIRIKRVRAIKFTDGSDGSFWNTNREYRMTLENDKLTGIVGIPADTYGSDDGTSDNGNVNLVLSE